MTVEYGFEFLVLERKDDWFGTFACCFVGVGHDQTTYA
jgi:hypothetical protein